MSTTLTPLPLAPPGPGSGGLAGSVNFPSNIIIPPGPPAPNSAHIFIQNESSYELVITMQISGASFYLTAGEWSIIPIISGETGYNVIIDTTSGSTLVQKLYTTYYEPGETLPLINTSGNTFKSSAIPAPASVFSAGVTLDTAHSSADLQILVPTGLTAVIMGLYIVQWAVASAAGHATYVTANNWNGVASGALLIPLGTAACTPPVPIIFPTPIAAPSVGTAVHLTLHDTGGGLSVAVTNLVVWYYFQ